MVKPKQPTPTRGAIINGGGARRGAHVCSRDRGCTSRLVRIGAKVAFALVRGLIEPARTALVKPSYALITRCYTCCNACVCVTRKDGREREREREEDLDRANRVVEITRRR